jgi:SAM-dependent methyltransferase
LLLLIAVVATKHYSANSRREGFAQSDAFIVKTGPDIYDDFYSDIYDYLVFNNLKNDYEIGEIVKHASPTSQSRILDVGCGTGHHVALLGAQNIETVGIDLSPAMVHVAKKSYPQYDFRVADALNSATFGDNTFTHVLCLYFTIYYFKDKHQFFTNAMKWLAPGGYLVVHLVDEHKFDPILPPGNPLLLVSPQKYAKKRITNTSVKFNDFQYTSDFRYNEKTHEAVFVEKFTNDNDGKVRKNELTLYMPSADTIVAEAQSAGFILDGKVDLTHCQYEYQYLYVFVKPE